MSDWCKAENHKWCFQCQGKVVEGITWVHGYDEVNGFPITHRYLQCVNWRWWRSHHFRKEFFGDHMVLKKVPEQVGH